MALTLATVITAARDKHPGFHKTRATDAVVARFLSDYQNTLIGLGLQRDRDYLSQSMVVALNLAGANDPGTAGAGTTGGLPGSVTDGSVSVVQESAGALVETALSVADGGNVIVAERVATAATANTISSTGAGRTTNQDAGRLVHVTGGKGRGQVRAIASNTGDQWTVTANWTTIPDTTSTFTVVQATLVATEEAGVVTGLPALSTRTGYLVRLNAQGTPYIDYTLPLTVSVDRGVPMPSVAALLGGSVRYTDGDSTDLCITEYRQRFSPPFVPAVYRVGEEIFLCGEETDWEDVDGLELRYAPVAPALTALADYFLVPDAARPALVAQAAAFMAARVEALGDVPVNVEVFDARAAKAEKDYLSTFRVSHRGRTKIMPEGAY